MVPDLVATLGRVRAGNQGRIGSGNGNEGKEVVVLLAMKVRHESEMVFFELMDKEGWVVRERCGIGLGVVGEDEGEGEEIELFVFGSEGR